ncbi:hypothetical protein ACQ4N7_06270 [Nodosilinea sp. AN01ver1]|uniref:hypothetical protein n=1 Tax=Nodosilinea sp. AN01ver1 TaxID=3423362 RepID=UPI003D31282D
MAVSLESGSCLAELGYSERNTNHKTWSNIPDFFGRVQSNPLPLKSFRPCLAICLSCSVNLSTSAAAVLVQSFFPHLLFQLEQIETELSDVPSSAWDLEPSHRQNPTPRLEFGLATTLTTEKPRPGISKVACYTNASQVVEVK